MYVDAMPVSYVKCMLWTLEKYGSCLWHYFVFMFTLYCNSKFHEFTGQMELYIIHVKAMYSNEFWSELMALKWKSHEGKIMYREKSKDQDYIWFDWTTFNSNLSKTTLRISKSERLVKGNFLETLTCCVNWTMVQSIQGWTCLYVLH